MDPIPSTIYSFDSLQITATNGTGLRTRNGGVVNINSPATIAVTGGPALDLENTAGTSGGVAGSGFTFLDVSSTDSGSNGIRLNNLNSDLRVIGTTTITGADGTSLSITDNTGAPQTNALTFGAVNISDRNNLGMLVDGVYGQVQVASLTISNGNNVAGDAVFIQNTTNPADPVGTGSGRVYISGGSISDSGGNGIQLRNALASISGVTVLESAGQSIIATAGSGETTTVEISNSSLATAVGINGLMLEATGSGVVNGTLFSTLIDVPTEAMSAVANGGFVSMDANGNFGAAAPAPGTGGFTLDNQGGTLVIDQSSTSAMATANNGVAITVPGNPVTFSGNTPPVPPPTP